MLKRSATICRSCANSGSTLGRAELAALLLNVLKVWFISRIVCSSSATLTFSSAIIVPCVACMLLKVSGQPSLSLEKEESMHDVSGAHLLLNQVGTRIA